MRQLIVDTSCELNDNMIDQMELCYVPFVITMGNRVFVDDLNLDMEDFFHTMKNTNDTIRTACPSPDDFYRVMKGDEIFVITITSKLSGTYSSAMIAKQMYLEENPNAKVHVFDSASAVSGESGIALFINDLAKEGKEFKEIVRETEEMMKRSVTVIALSSLTNLARNGRMPKFAGKLSRVLNIKLIARAKDGKILPISIEKGVKRTINTVVEKCKNLCDMTLKCQIVISHANQIDMAEAIKAKISEIFPSRKINITGMKGLSSTYAEEGGIVVFL